MPPDDGIKRDSTACQPSVGVGHGTAQRSATRALPMRAPDACLRDPGAWRSTLAIDAWLRLPSLT